MPFLSAKRMLSAQWYIINYIMIKHLHLRLLLRHLYTKCTMFYKCCFCILIIVAFKFILQIIPCVVTNTFMVTICYLLTNEDQVVLTSRRKMSGILISLIHPKELRIPETHTRKVLKFSI